MQFNNFEEKKINIPPEESVTRLRKEEDENGAQVLAHARERWLEIMKGQGEEGKGERIDFEKNIPDIEYFFGEKFSIKPGKWWMTSTVGGEKTLNYPREYGFIPPDVSPEEREKQIDIQGGGILHEMGHHAGVVKSLEAMMREADTGERILGDLSLGEAGQKRISDTIEKQRKELERLGMETNMGPYVGNLMFLHDLQNVVLDIWLEAYLSHYPSRQFATEADRKITSLNHALFEKIPETLNSESFSGQFKSSILLRMMRPDLMAPSDGTEVWFREGFVTPEVTEALLRMKKGKILETLTDSEELSDIFMPEERLKWVKKEKLQNAYFAIRREFIDLLKIDVERAVEEATKKQNRKNGEGKGQGGEKGEKSNGEKQNEEGGEGQESEGGEKSQEGKPGGEKGEKGTPSFDDLSAEAQANLINELIERMEREEIGSGALSQEDAEQNESLNQLSREAIMRELQNRREREEEAERRKKGEKTKDDSKEKNEEKEGSQKDTKEEGKNERASQRETMERGVHAAQRHAASEMERGTALGLSVDQLREFEKKRSLLDSNINYFRDELIGLFRTKLEPERKTHRPDGHLMSGHFSDFLRSVSHGEEARTFEYLSFKQAIPSIDLLFLVDHSGSMETLQKNEKAAEVVLMFGEALMRANGALEKQTGGGRKKREFLREGLITFDETPTLQKPLDTPLDEKSVAQLYFGAKNISGGSTADAKALSGLIEYLKGEKGKYHGRQKVMNIVVILSDGQGEKEKVQEVLKTAADLPNTLFIAVGVGKDTEEMLDTWKGSYGRATVVSLHIPDEKILEMPQQIIAGMKNDLRKKFTTP